MQSIRAALDRARAVARQITFKHALTLGLPAGLSVLVHALVLVVMGFVAWRFALPELEHDRDVFIAFDSPATGAAAPRVTAPNQSPAQPDDRPRDDPAGARAMRPQAYDQSPPTHIAGLTSAAVSEGDVELKLESAVNEGAPPLVSGDRRSPPSGEVRFAGMGTSNARSVVYVIDGSGPMVSSLPLVLKEVERSVNALSQSQKFGVVVFRSMDGVVKPGGVSQAAPKDDGYEWFTPVMVRATPEAKKKLAEWLVGMGAARGRSNPMQGLSTGLGMKPDAVFLLSRSIERSGGGVWDLGLQGSMDELDHLNPVDTRTGRRPAVIKTVQFIDEDPSGVMQAIGRVHGGSGPTGGGSGGGGGGAYTVIRREGDLGR